VLPPSIIERGEINLPRMLRQMCANGLWQVVSRLVWHDGYGVTATFRTPSR
jgi:hypothetical protein